MEKLLMNHGESKPCTTKHPPGAWRRNTILVRGVVLGPTDVRRLVAVFLMTCINMQFLRREVSKG